MKDFFASLREVLPPACEWLARSHRWGNSTPKKGLTQRRKDAKEKAVRRGVNLSDLLLLLAIEMALDFPSPFFSPRIVCSWHEPTKADRGKHRLAAP